MDTSGGTPSEENPRKSWAEVLSRNLPANSNKKNVLEVILEKDEKGPFIVTQDECVKLMKKIGMDMKPGVHVEEIQICPNGRGLIYITLNKDIRIEQFCRYDVVEVNSNGVRAINMKPVNKREAIVNIRNIHPNTKDDVVMEYLNKFGKVSKKSACFMSILLFKTPFLLLQSIEFVT